MFAVYEICMISIMDEIIKWILSPLNSSKPCSIINIYAVFNIEFISCCYLYCFWWPCHVSANPPITRGRNPS